MSMALALGYVGMQFAILVVGAMHLAIAVAIAREWLHRRWVARHYVEIMEKQLDELQTGNKVSHGGRTGGVRGATNQNMRTM